jgi:hypothetical protein
LPFSTFCSLSDKFIRFNDSDTQAYEESHPFKLVKIENRTASLGEIAFDVSHEGIIKDGSQKKVVTPEEVGSEVLKYLLRITASFMGHNRVCALLRLNYFDALCIGWIMGCLLPPLCLFVGRQGCHRRPGQVHKRTAGSHGAGVQEGGAEGALASPLLCVCVCVCV